MRVHLENLMAGRLLARMTNLTYLSPREFINYEAEGTEPK